MFQLTASRAREWYGGEGGRYSLGPEICSARSVIAVHDSMNLVCSAERGVTDKLLVASTSPSPAPPCIWASWYSGAVLITRISRSERHHAISICQPVINFSGRADSWKITLHDRVRISENVFALSSNVARALMRNARNVASNGVLRRVSRIIASANNAV